MEKIFNYKYLSKKDLRGFDGYKYSAVDTSPFSNYVMHPFWNASVKLFPKWLAPNLVTFVGFLFMVAAVVLLAVYDYGCFGPLRGDIQTIPNWVFTTCAAFIFLAYNLDGMDGKQARRIGVTGPLGELFDHGLDSYVVFFIPYCLMSVFGRDHEYTLSTFRGFLVIISVSLNFYVSHFAKYNTGTLYIPWGYDISLWASSLLVLLPGVYGPYTYHTHVLGFKFIKVVEVTVHATGLFTTLPIVVHNMYFAKKEGTLIYKSVAEIIRPIYGMLFMHVVILVWAVKSPNKILEYDPKAFVMMYGTYFSNICSRLIVAAMSKQRCEVYNWMSWCLLAGAAVSIYLPTLEVASLYTVLLLSLAGHLHYGICVVRQLCGHFKIKCFTVPKSKRK